VPIVAGEWDNTKTYEPLMVVTYQGASYTSRQYVPAGIEITNESYWVLSANYNAQFEAYRKEVRDILPYDETPTEGSTKGVTSDGIKKAISKAVSTETTRATTAEKANADAIIAETTRATAAEKVNEDAINTILPMDTTPTKDSTKGITSSGVYKAVTEVSNSLDTITPLDITPTQDSTKGVTSGGVFSARIYRTIEDYGCSSNVSDNSENLQNAINDAAANGYILVIPAKTYSVSTAIYLPWHTYIRGISRNNSVIKFTGNQGFYCKNDINGYPTCVDCNISNFTINGNFDYANYLVASYKEVTDFIENAAISGWFTNCEIYNINIINFRAGILMFMPSFASGAYNSLYNNIYGDLRSVHDIDISHCGYGAFFNEHDMMLYNLDIHSIEKCPLKSIGNKLSNVHEWGIRTNSIIGDGSQVNNIEIESQQYIYDAIGTEIPKTSATIGAVDSMITVESGNNGVSLNNVYLWNSQVEKSSLSSNIYYHPYIRPSDNNTGNISILNLKIGHDPDRSSNTQNIMQRRIFEQHGTGLTILQGIISNVFTSTYNDQDIFNTHCFIIYKLIGNSSISRYNTIKQPTTATEW
jgi:hypothetical protein